MAHPERPAAQEKSAEPSILERLARVEEMVMNLANVEKEHHKEITQGNICFREKFNARLDKVMRQIGQ